MVKPYGKYNGMRKMRNINMYVIEICFLRLSDEIKKKKKTSAFGKRENVV